MESGGRHRARLATVHHDQAVYWSTSPSQRFTVLRFSSCDLDRTCTVLEAVQRLRGQYRLDEMAEIFEPKTKGIKPTPKQLGKRKCCAERPTVSPQGPPRM